MLASSNMPARSPAAVASLPDRGDLVVYDKTRRPVRKGAYTWHVVQLSEEHALRAVTGAELLVTGPNGQPIRLQYERHVEHPDGNWTWIGRVPGAKPGAEAILTFGEKAVFGSIPYGDEEPLRLTTTGGRAWLMQTDRAMIARLDNAGTRPRKPDFLLPPRIGNASTPGAHLFSAAQVAEKVTATAATTVDVLIGYTNGFATRLGGQSQATTRLTYLVDVTNQAYANSQIDAQVRLVRAMQVTYPDNTSNQAALYALTGVTCTDQPNGSLDCEIVGSPASLQPLHTARDQYGADLVSLVRNFNDPENDGCGIAWLNGGGQRNITSDDQFSGMSVISDSNGTGPGSFPDNSFVCRDESLAHELGHNMGSAHDRDTADGDDDVLQPGEYGRYPYSFGHKTDAGAGNFFTVMTYGDTGQTKYRVFSNPDITYCGGRACGVANQADNARSLRQTMPVVAGFLSAESSVELPSNHFSGDFNGDGKSDIFWRNFITGTNVVWRSGNKGSPQAITAVTNLDWRIVGVGDFGGDGKWDVLWRNVVTGVNTIWKSANIGTQQAVASVTDVRWEVAGVGDFDGDGKADILWRNSATGYNSIWKSGNKATAVSSLNPQQWVVVGVGDFNGDALDDVLWRNTGTGANTIWRSANGSTVQALATVANFEWQVQGVGDFNGDGRSDVLWRNTSTGANTIWRSANSGVLQAVSSVTNQNWQVAGVGDFNGDAKADVLWREFQSGANSLWRSANSTQYQAIASITNMDWAAVP